MKTIPQCITCIIHDLIGAIIKLQIPEDLSLAIINDSLDFLRREYNFDRYPSTYITAVHRILKKHTGLEMPFKEVRQKCNEIGLLLGAKIEKELENMDDDLERIRYLIRWTIAGNVLDFRTVGTGYGFKFEEIEKIVREPFENGLAYDNTPEIFRQILDAVEILYIHDNVGEIALDKVFIKELTARYGKKVISALRGGPITSDAVLQDGIDVGLDKVASKIIIACGDTLGIQPDEFTPEFREYIENMPLVIAKGQANYYVLSEIFKNLAGEVICLFSSKCDPISAKFGLKGKVNIAALLR